MTDDLRTLLNRAVEHAVDYRTSLAEHAGRPAYSYVEMRERLDEPLPEHGRAPLAVLDELAAHSEGGLTDKDVAGATRASGIAAAMGGRSPAAE